MPSKIWKRLGSTLPESALQVDPVCLLDEPESGHDPTLAVAGRKVRALVQTRQLKASKRNDITRA